jgi:integrase
MGKLTDLEARNAAAGRHGDGDGLYLVVKPSGARSWVLRVTHDGRAREIGLGAYDDTGKQAGKLTLAKARAAAAIMRAEVKAGKNVVAERKAAKAGRMTANRNTFEELARAVFDYRVNERRHRKGFKLAARTNEIWLGRLEKYAFPLIGKEPVAQIDVAAIRNVVKPLWQSVPHTATRVFMAVAEVLDYGNAEGLCGPAPAKATIAKRLGDQPEPQHRAAVHPADAPKIIASLNAKDKTEGRLCLLFTVLTASRSIEARGAKWGEVDMEAAVWSRPAERMKTRVAHRVALSAPAMAILHEALARRCLETAKPPKPTDLIFPGKGGRALADMSLLKAHKLESATTTVHGWRSTFSSWAAAHTHHAEDLREFALAHIHGSEAARAYQRDDLLEKRRPLMADWATYILTPPADGAGAGGNVIAMASRKAAARR